ncbi:hypothetical protein MP228_006556 [Amoeboaphelidium protococcarum]|nr:hypothetical protein MP228_006556 [Amoeboaphelidium protococcarum]
MAQQLKSSVIIPSMHAISRVKIPLHTTSVPAVQPLTWTRVEERTGLLAIKKGMMSVWDQQGRRVPATVLQLDKTIVLGHKTERRDGYDALVVGCRSVDVDTMEKLDKYQSHVAISRQAAIGYCVKHFSEFKVSPNGFIPVGTFLNAAHFVPGQFVDVQSRSKDKGFQGVVKRWGFHGQSASHGVSKAHRSGGSIGMRKTPGKVFKGKKMPGHMGDENVTVHSLQVLRVDRLLNLLYIKGSIPGDSESCVKVLDSLFKNEEQFDPYLNPPPFPTISPQSLELMPAELSIQSGDDAAKSFASKYQYKID